MHQPLTRRKLVSSALAAALGLPALPGLPGAALAAACAGPDCGTFACDALVIGAGAAGLSAAIEAREAGAQVIVIEKAAQVGGNTLLASEAIIAAKGLVGDESAFERDAILEEHRRFLSELLERGRTGSASLDGLLIGRSGEALRWLEGLGCNLSVRDPHPGFRQVLECRPGDGIPIGVELMRHLLFRVEELGIPVLTRTRATHVARPKTDSGAKDRIAVTAEDALGRSFVLSARSVILATGGFAGNLDLITRFNPKAPQLTTTNANTAAGDGLVLGREAGAAFADLDAVVMQPTANPLTGSIIPYAFRRKGAILVNAEGRRFVNELALPEEVSQAILEQPEGFAWLIADSTVPSTDALEEDFRTPYGWHADDTALSLARTIDANFYTLSKTLEECRTTRCTMRHRLAVRPQACASFTNPPFHAIRVRPAYHGTPGGVVVDAEARALDDAGSPIPGLFASGEVTGGVLGTARIDNLGLIEAVVFGRISGVNAARNALGTAAL